MTNTILEISTNYRGKYIGEYIVLEKVSVIEKQVVIKNGELIVFASQEVLQVVELC